MKALIIGGGGYIGGRLAARLLDDDWDVTTLCLREHSPGPEPPPRAMRVLFGDRADAGVLGRAMAGNPDVVVDLIAYKPTETAAVVRAGAGRLRRLVHLSTVSVYRDYPLTGRATEQTAVRFEGGGEGYGPEKAACERALEQASREQGFPYVILRAAPIMGPADPCSREGYFAARILAGQAILHPGPATGRLWLLFIDDLIDALVRACTAPVLGRVFHLADEEAPSLRRHIAALADGLGAPTPDLRVLAMDDLARLGFRLYGFPFARALAVPPDTTAAREELGWRPTPYEAALSAVLDGAKVAANRAALPTWPGRNTTQARLSGTHPWIHSALEARLLAGIATPPGPDVGAILGWLVGERTAGGRLELVGAEAWQEQSAPVLGRPHEVHADIEDRSSRFISLPESLRQRLSTASGRSRPSADLARTPAPGALPMLVAAFEPDRWCASRSWLYTHPPAPVSPHYGWSTEPCQVDVLPLGSCLDHAPGPAERLLVDTNDSADAALMHRHLCRCQEQGVLVIEEPEVWARIYVLAWARWLPEALREAVGRRDGADETPAAGARELESLPPRQLASGGWVLSHGIARLLCLAGIAAPTAICMGGTNLEARPLALPATSALCHSSRGAHVVDFVGRRVIEVPMAVGSVLASPAIWPLSLTGVRRTSTGWLCKEA